MNYIAKWCDDIQSRAPRTVSAPLAVTGIRDQHLGPRWDYAEIEMIVEPATHFDVQFRPDVDTSETHRSFLEAAIFGLLDILLVDIPRPLRNISITVTRCETDPITSSQMAFRYAGQDAAKKILSAIS